ncbi:transglutaminase domain-containing protein [Novipirellula caenicola]|uniref:Transglutaminase-like domain-containing protein n=1 Tax=Novipirellula caenicola TaxID=1536901 RepID=A0ABP9VLM5_9BACT
MNKKLSSPSTPQLSRRSLLGQALHQVGICSVGGLALSQLALADDPVQPESSDASDEPDAVPSRLTFDSPQIQQWRIGMVLTTPVMCTNVIATFPVPTEWPEQKVTVVNRVIDPIVRAWEVRDLASGAKQVALQIPQVPAGARVEMTFVFQIERSRILPPTQTDDLVIPQRPSRELRNYLGNSPNIDASNSIIRSASRELAAQEAENDWQRVEQIYDYVREKVEYVEGPLKNASVALRDGKGDCEEMTSLVVALCRNARVPARMVWIPGHCYPEFYLEDGDGNGFWFPCQAAGTRQFGRMDEYRPVLQKGDRFKVPEKRQPVRYVAEYFKCDRKGKGNPDPGFVREQIEI